MLTDAERRRFEDEFARLLGRASAQARRDLVALLGDPPKLELITNEVWDTIRRSYSGTIMPLLEQAYLSALTASADALGVGVAWDLVNERAVSWARQYTYELVEGINRRSRDWLRQAVVDFYEGGLSHKDMVTRIQTMFGAQRASTIAVTEVTRAAAAGVAEHERELRESGLNTKRVVHTAMDDVTCSICAPKEGKPTDEVGDPPFHPMCRCWEAVEVLTPEGAAL